MLRNREFKLLLILLIIIAVALTSVCIIFSLYAGIAAFAGSLIFIGLFVFFTRRRYAQLAQLNAYLKRINSGDYALDVRDNAEGELSILKSEIYKVTVMLRERNEALTQDKTMLANAISDISHQLKTPLTSMLMMTDLLCEPDLPDEKRIEFTNRTRLQLERLQWLVSSLLKLSKLDAKTVRFTPRSVPVPQLLEKASAPLRIPMELKNQTLKLPDNEAFVCCDLNWTAEAIINILKNCMEHTPENGEIRVSFCENPIFAQLTIEDTGTGIDEKDLPNIFKRFYRGKNASDESVGIGLSMAATILQEQGGSIDVKSGPHGSSFFIRFPK